MANNWYEITPDLVAHEFEIYDNCTAPILMSHFHCHDFYELRFIKSGNVQHYCENSTVQLSAGDVSIIPPGVFHRTDSRLSPQPKPLYTRLLLYVSSAFMQTLDSDRFSISDLFTSFANSSTPYFHMDSDELVSYYQPLQEIVRRNRDEEPLSHLINRAQVELMLARIAERILQCGPHATPVEDSALIPRVIAYINANLSEPLSLDSLADRFSVSKFYLSHQFKQYTQLSLHQYVLARRMLHAKSLLRAGQSPSAVAIACSYQEYSSFYKAFLRETGQSPRNFK